MQTQYVVLHRPGRAWKEGVPVLEQPGLQAHVDHFRVPAHQALLFAMGPFLGSTAGGMAIFKRGASREQVVQLCEADPSFRSELLVFEILEWFSPQLNGEPKATLAP